MSSACFFLPYKALVLLMALSLARDEIAWMVRHSEATVPKMSKMKVNPEEFQDRWVVAVYSLFAVVESSKLVCTRKSRVEGVDGRYPCDMITIHETESVRLG